jgi:dienelactone hydrolase
MKTWLAFVAVVLSVGSAQVAAAQKDAPRDPVAAEQAEHERKQLAADERHSLAPQMAEYRQTAEKVEYPSGDFKLPGFLYRPAGRGPFPAVIWNHGSEKNPTAHPELARFYTQHGYIFFAPIRHGHAPAAGDYIVDLQEAARQNETDLRKVRTRAVELHDQYSADVAAAVAWLKQQPFVDADRLVVTGVSYGGIQTLLAAEKGLGVKAFIAFAPGAMSFANEVLQERMKTAAKNAKAPLLLLQAKNDYSTGPSEILAPLLKEKGGPSHSTIYPAFGSTNAHGHGGFACWSLGIQQWGPEVLTFLETAVSK